MEAKIKSYAFGKYTLPNELFLKDNLNKRIKCQSISLHYLQFDNGYVCHTLDCITFKPKQ